MSSSPKERSGVADPEREEHDAHPDSFDPGVETGYLRRARRDHDLDIDVGAAPFDPGEEHYDERRAKREQKRREKEERLRREEAEQRERERAELEAEERRRAREAQLEYERAERERQSDDEQLRAGDESERRAEELRAMREESEREEGERAERAHAERERLRAAELAERDAREREREERKRAEREARDRALAEETERKRAERAERDRRDREAREERERRRAQRKSRKTSGKRPRRRRRRPPAAAPEPPPSRSSAPSRGGGTAVATRPAAKPRPKRTAAEVAVRPGPRPRKKAPPARLEGESPGASLRRPTAKAALAIAGVTAVALAFGAVLGLPLPIVGGETDETPASVTPNGAALEGITVGTPIGLTAGPYNPVVKPTGYGEAAAKFHADRGGRKHEGQDIFGAIGTPLVAVRDGIVLDGAGGTNFYESGGGNSFVMYSPLDNRSYVYLHMQKPAFVKAGDQVKAGQLIGLLGCTGSCDGPHLHFEIRNGRADWGAETKAIDPMPLLKTWPQRPAAKVEPPAPQKGAEKPAPAATP
jgi:murein DD-endopeptidase MepM/ murein hydrolase activator NlpD